jgi:hypothetical protein
MPNPMDGKTLQEGPNMTQTKIMGIALLMFGSLYILLANQAETVTGLLGYLSGSFMLILGIAALFVTPKNK